MKEFLKEILKMKGIKDSDLYLFFAFFASIFILGYFEVI